jgi:hypothetical protein
MERVLKIHSAIMVLVFLILGLVFLGAGAPQAIAEPDGETSAFSVASGEVTLIGRLNEVRQLEAWDGKVYNIARNEKGRELRALATIRKVEVKGTVKEGYGGALTITIDSYKPLSDSTYMTDGTIRPSLIRRLDIE